MFAFTNSSFSLRYLHTQPYYLLKIEKCIILLFLQFRVFFYRARRHETNWNFYHWNYIVSFCIFLLQLNDKRIPFARLCYKYTFSRQFRIKLNFCPCVKGNNKNSFALFCFCASRFHKKKLYWHTPRTINKTAINLFVIDQW